MKIAIVLLLNNKIYNFIRKLQVEMHQKYQVGFTAASAPPHISLKQPFSINNLATAEHYFDEFVASIKPFEITFNKIELKFVPENNQEKGILWLAVAPNNSLIDLHNRLNHELAQRFENTQADFDGPAYQFHATLAVGTHLSEIGPKLYAEYHDLTINLNYKVKHVLLFYKENDKDPIRDFIAYKRLAVNSE